MVLNFLKGKKPAHHSILLYHHLDLKPVPNQQMETPILYKDDLSNSDKLPSDKPVKSDTDKQEDQGNKKESLELTKSECSEEMIIGSAAVVENWNKVIERIDKLLHEISGSQTGDDFSSKQKETITELLHDKTKVIKKEKQSVPSPRNKSLYRENSFIINFLQRKRGNLLQHSSPEKADAERICKSEHESPKHPLDVHELQTIAAMAKRLRAHTKIKSPTKSD